MKWWETLKTALWSTLLGALVASVGIGVYWGVWTIIRSLGGL